MSGSRRRSPTPSSTASSRRARPAARARPGELVTSPRQGLARLQQMGLTEVRHGSGSVVRDPEGLTIPGGGHRGAGAQTKPDSRRVAGDPRGVSLLIGRLAAARARLRMPRRCAALKWCNSGQAAGAAGSRSCLTSGCSYALQPRIGVVTGGRLRRPRACAHWAYDVDSVLTDLRAINGAVLADRRCRDRRGVSERQCASMVKSYRDRAKRQAARVAGCTAPLIDHCGACTLLRVLYRPSPRVIR